MLRTLYVAICHLSSAFLSSLIVRLPTTTPSPESQCVHTRPLLCLSLLDKASPSGPPALWISRSLYLPNCLPDSPPHPTSDTRTRPDARSVLRQIHYADARTPARTSGPDYLTCAHGRSTYAHLALPLSHPSPADAHRPGEPSESLESILCRSIRIPAQSITGGCLIWCSRTLGPQAFRKDVSPPSRCVSLSCICLLLLLLLLSASISGYILVRRSQSANPHAQQRVIAHSGFALHRIAVVECGMIPVNHDTRCELRAPSPSCREKTTRRGRGHPRSRCVFFLCPRIRIHIFALLVPLSKVPRASSTSNT